MRFRWATTFVLSHPHCDSSVSLKVSIRGKLPSTLQTIHIYSFVFINITVYHELGFFAWCISASDNVHDRAITNRPIVT
jgi:hypothetical protein